jgi:hypothetical protein
VRRSASATRRAIRGSRDHRQPAPCPLAEPLHKVPARHCAIPHPRRVQLCQQQTGRPRRGSIRTGFARNGNYGPRFIRRRLTVLGDLGTRRSPTRTSGGAPTDAKRAKYTPPGCSRDRGGQVHPRDPRRRGGAHERTPIGLKALAIDAQLVPLGRAETRDRSPDRARTRSPDRSDPNPIGGNRARGGDHPRAVPSGSDTRCAAQLRLPGGRCTHHVEGPVSHAIPSTN